jgi:hypothetical protein
MRFRSIAVTFLSLCAGSLAAQTTPISPSCPGGAVGSQAQVTQDACQQAIDLFNYFRPQLGIAIAGGNATLGQAGSLGGLPHFTIGVRANVLQGSVPTIQQPVATGAVRRNPYPTKETLLGLPAVDASIGLFKGLPFGVTNIGGVDLLLSAAYVPKINTGNVSVEPNTPLQIGYGARIGLLQESLLVPGLGVTFLKRGLPKTTITGVTTTTNDSAQVKDLDLQTTAWRIVASKSLILFTLAAGVGQDTYDASTTVNAVVHAGGVVGRQATSVTLAKQSMKRTNYFADVAMNLLLFKLFGEVGMVSGGTVDTYNVFDKKADASRLYGSVGLRFGF